MRYKRSQRVTLASSLVAVITFVFVSIGAVVWANGLRYNPATHKFEQTVLIAIDGDSQDVTVRLNGQQIADHIPYRVRNLLPDHYIVELTKPGYQTWSQNFWLSKGQVGVINNPTLIATAPLVTSVSELPSPPSPTLDFGLALTSGELTDQGNLVTRFGSQPLQVDRFNDYYLYQVGRELRLFQPASSQDFLVYSATSPGLLPLNLSPSNWQLTVQDGLATKQISLTVPGATGR